MPGRIRQEDIAAVRERSPIADVVGEYLQLRPAGGGHLKGLCPFHDERTPSFNVTPGKELYHCFSCGEGGDVIDRKSTRLNSSHMPSSYAVFCLKKKHQQPVPYGS